MHYENKDRPNSLNDLTQSILGYLQCGQMARLVGARRHRHRPKGVTLRGIW